jgi:hypothetical protein
MMMVMMMMMMMMMMMPTMFLLPKSKPCRSVVEVQKGDDYSQERSKGKANDEPNLDVVICSWVIRELSPYKSGMLANMTEGVREWMKNGWGSMALGSLQMRRGNRDIHQSHRSQAEQSQNIDMNVQRGRLTTPKSTKHDADKILIS